MPPSGFDDKHSKKICGFLRSCIDDMIIENRGVRTPAQAVKQELKHIASDLRQTQRGPLATKVLELTQVFYSDLAQKKSRDFQELQAHSEELLEAAKSEIEAIQIADLV